MENRQELINVLLADLEPFERDQVKQAIQQITIDTFKHLREPSDAVPSQPSR